MLRGSTRRLRHGEESNTARHQDQDVENHIRLRHLLHPVRRQRIDETGDDGQTSHDTDRLADIRKVGEVGPDRDCGEQKGSSAPFGGSDTISREGSVAVHLRVWENGTGYPAIWPSRFIHPTTQLMDGTQALGARRETV